MCIFKIKSKFSNFQKFISSKLKKIETSHELGKLIAPYVDPGMLHIDKYTIDAWLVIIKHIPKLDKIFCVTEGLKESSAFPGLLKLLRSKHPDVNVMFDYIALQDANSITLTNDQQYRNKNMLDLYWANM